MKFLICIFLLLRLTAYSQEIAEFGRSYSDSLPEAFKLDISKLREHIYAGVPDNYKEDYFAKMTYHFADVNAYNISRLISSSRIYSDWAPLENYLNEILVKIIPEELKGDSVIKVYLIQYGGNNAFMVPSGHIFVHIGLFSDINDEATIAGILAHELGHYYLKHSLIKYVKREEGDFSGTLRTEKLISRFSINQELEADSLAIRWLRNSDYHIRGIMSGFEIEERAQQNQISRLEDKWELKETTHPLAKRRRERLEGFYNKYKDEPGQLFLISEEKFKKFKEEAKPEILKILLNDFKYYDCIEQAFKFHIFDPDNRIYIYYLMEGIRRNCYLNRGLWKKMFITNRYYDTLNVDGERRKRAMKDHLFVKFNFDVLQMDTSMAAKIKADFYWQEAPKFTTYEEAFEFYIKAGELFNCRECILSNALSYVKNDEKRDSILRQYLSMDSILFRDFAENLLAKTITKKLSNRKMIVFDQLTASVRLGQDDIPIRLHNSDSIDAPLIVFDSISNEFKDYKTVFLQRLKNYRLNDFRLFTRLMQFSRIQLLSFGDKIELHILEPEFWNTFLTYDVNEINFITCDYFEARGSENSIEAYKSVMNADFNSIFKQVKRTRFLTTFISSVREIDGGVMKFSQYEGETHLKSKEEGYPQIFSEIKYNLTRKEKRVIEADAWYKEHH